VESAAASFVLKLTASSKKNHLRNLQLRLIAHLKNNVTRVMVGCSCNGPTSRYFSWWQFHIMDFIFLQTFASATPIASYQQPTTNSEVNTIQVQGSIFCPIYSSPLPQSSMLHLIGFTSCIHHFYHYPHWNTGTSCCYCRLNLRPHSR